MILLLEDSPITVLVEPMPSITANLAGLKPELWRYILDLRFIKAIKEDIDIIRGGPVDTLIIHQSSLTRTDLRVAGL